MLQVKIIPAKIFKSRLILKFHFLLVQITE